MSLPPELAEEFEYRGELGKGAQGRVLRVVQRSLGREVALKLVPQHDDPEYQARFEREARVLSRLDHPALVRLYTFGVAGEWLYHACALMPGESIEERVKREGPFHWAKAARVGAAIADGLHELHQLGVIHRDVKPSNILLTVNDRPVLLDLGVSHDARDERLTAEGWFVGTPACAAPEQIGALAVGPATDLYSLAVTLVMMVTGVNPFAGATAPMTMQNHLSLDPGPFLRKERRGMPEAMVLLLGQLLRKEPELRPSSAAEVRDRLEEIGGGREGLTGPGADAGSSPRVIDPFADSGGGIAGSPLATVALSGEAPAVVKTSPPSVAASGTRSRIFVTRVTPAFFGITFALGILIGLRPWSGSTPAPVLTSPAPVGRYHSLEAEGTIRSEKATMEKLRARRVRAYQIFVDAQMDPARELIEGAIREGLESLDTIEDALGRLPPGTEAATYRAALLGLRYRHRGQLISCISFSRGELLARLAGTGFELSGLPPAMVKRIPPQQDARSLEQFRTYVDALRQAFSEAIRSPLDPERLFWHLDGIHDAARIVSTFPWEPALFETRDQYVGLLERSIPQWGEGSPPGGPLFSSLFLLVWNWGKNGGGGGARDSYVGSVRHHTVILEGAYPADRDAIAEVGRRCELLGSTDLTAPGP